MIDESRLYRRLGARIRDLRTEGLSGGKLTQAELARAVGLERTSITNIERGIQKVPLHVLYRICEVLETPISEVLPAPSVVNVPDAMAEESVEGFNERVTPLVKQKLTELLSRDSA